MSCFFCDAIVNKDQYPLIYDDSEFAILMDQYPIKTGHLILFPLEHIPDIMELSSPRLATLMGLAAKLSYALKRTYGVEKVGLFAAGQAMTEHGHMHLLPLSEGLKKTFEGLSVRERPLIDRITLITEGQRILSNSTIIV